jgi:anti-anti-sigma factor
MPLTLNSRHLGNVYILQCHGRIALGDEMKSMEAALEFATREFSRLVLNMSSVARVDSTGIGLLVRYATNLRKRNGDLRLADPPPFLTALLNLANLSPYLHALPTEEDAIVSFLKQRVAEKTQARPGQRVVVVDQSPDLCAFIRTLLTQRGFDVQSTYSYRDARIMLKVQPAEFILVGPGTGQLSTDFVVKTLQTAAPAAKTVPLGEDFHSRDAHEATEALLQLLGAS